VRQQHQVDQQAEHGDHDQEENCERQARTDFIVVPPSELQQSNYAAGSPASRAEQFSRRRHKNGADQN
jgi:hypothetical protein